MVSLYMPCWAMEDKLNMIVRDFIGGARDKQSPTSSLLSATLYCDSDRFSSTTGQLGLSAELCRWTFIRFVLPTGAG